MKYVVEFEREFGYWRQTSGVPGVFSSLEAAQAAIDAYATVPEWWRVAELHVSSEAELAAEEDARLDNDESYGTPPAVLLDKACPIVGGLLDYFPNALAAVARHSKFGNDKHNPGEPLHWAFDKSSQHAESCVRHLMQRGSSDPETGDSHTIGAAWRALALLETELVGKGHARGRGVK